MKIVEPFEVYFLLRLSATFMSDYAFLILMNLSFYTTIIDSLQ